ATGFRTAELASMTPESFDLDGEQPTATVQAGCTKNRRLAVQPLPRNVAAVLRDYLRGKTAGGPGLPGTWANAASATTIRLDLPPAVQSLPIPTGAPDREAGARAATRTDGKTGEVGRKNLGPIHVPDRESGRDFLRQAETDDGRLPPAENPGKHAVFGVFRGS